MCFSNIQDEIRSLWFIYIHLATVLEMKLCFPLWHSNHLPRITSVCLFGPLFVDPEFFPGCSGSHPCCIPNPLPSSIAAEEPQVPAWCCCWWMWRHHYLLPSPITPSAHVCPFLSSLWWRGQLSFPSVFPYLRPFTVVCLSPTTWPLNCHWQLLSRCGSSCSPLPVVTAILPSTRGNTRIVGLFS